MLSFFNTVQNVKGKGPPVPLHSIIHSIVYSAAAAVAVVAVAAAFATLPECTRLSWNAVVCDLIYNVMALAIVYSLAV